MKAKEALTKIAENVFATNPRVLEYNLEFFKHVVRRQEGIELTDEEAKEVTKLIINLPEQKHDMRYLAVK